MTATYYKLEILESDKDRFDKFCDINDIHVYALGLTKNPKNAKSRYIVLSDEEMLTLLELSFEAIKYSKLQYDDSRGHIAYPLYTRE